MCAGGMRGVWGVDNTSTYTQEEMVEATYTGWGGGGGGVSTTHVHMVGEGEGEGEQWVEYAIHVCRPVWCHTVWLQSSLGGGRVRKLSSPLSGLQKNSRTCSLSSLVCTPRFLPHKQKPLLKVSVSKPEPILALFDTRTYPASSTLHTYIRTYIRTCAHKCLLCE